MTRSRLVFAIATLLFAAFALTYCASEPTQPERDTADLSIDKTDELDPVTIGDEIKYTITVSNGGPDGALAVRVTDAVPTGASFVSAAASQGTCSQAGGTVTCDVGSLASGSSATVALTVRADQDGQVSNTATVSSDVDDPSSSNNSDTETTVVELIEADVSVTKLSESTSVLLGAEIVYTITVENDGPGDASDVQVTDVIPTGTSFLDADPAQGACSEAGGTLTCDLGDLADGDDATITLTVRADEEGIVENTATVSAREPDPDETNNSDSDDTGVQTLPADLRITKVADVDPVAPGEDIVYTINVRNRGPNDVGAVRVTDAVPDGTIFVAAVPSQGDCSEAAGTVICDLGGLEFLHSAIVTLTVQSGEAGDVINTALVESSAQDTIPDNDTATDTTTVTALADLSIDKDDEEDPVEIGDEVIYFLDVVNRGPSDATDVIVRDTLPAGTDFEDATTTAGSCDDRQNVVSCLLGTLAVGDSVRITINATTEQVGFIDNRAVVASTVADPDLDNNSDRAGTNVTGPQADLTITKRDQTDPVNVGNNIVYTIDVINNGPDDVTDLTVTDPVPAGTSFVSASVNPGNCSEGGGVVTCNIPTLPSGVGTTITLTLLANQAGQVANTATVNAPLNVVDPDLTNNSATETTDVN